MSYDTSWHAEARALARAEPHLSYAALARRLGRGVGSVWRVLNPERAAVSEARRLARPGVIDERRRLHRRMARTPARRGTCASCRKPMGADYRPNGQCQRCRSAVHVARMSAIEGMWADGWPLRDIAGAAGVTSGTAMNCVKALRAEGRAPRRRG